MGVKLMYASAAVPFFVLVLIAGCSPVVVTMTTAHVTQPVMLGKAKTVDCPGANRSRLMEKVNIKKIHDTEIFPSFPAAYEHTNKADAELLKLIDSPHDRIVIHETAFRSWAFGVPGAYSGGQQVVVIEIRGVVERCTDTISSIGNVNNEKAAKEQ